jgi:hypothetical protein
VGFRLYRWKSLGRGFWLGLSKSGPSFGRRGKPLSASAGGRGVGGSIRLMKGLSYMLMMRGLLLALALTAVLAFAALTVGYTASPASAHRARCHQAHTCPSDHATYRWRRWLCVPASATPASGRESAGRAEPTGARSRAARAKSLSRELSAGAGVEGRRPFPRPTACGAYGARGRAPRWPRRKCLLPLGFGHLSPSDRTPCRP